MWSEAKINSLLEDEMFENGPHSALLSTFLTSALSVSAFLAGLIAKAWVDHAFGVRTNRLLEELKSEFRSGEAKAQVARNEIGAIRNLLLERLSARTSAVDAKRIEAAEQLWGAVVDLAPFRSLGEMAKSMDFEKMLARASRDDSEAKRLQNFAEVLIGNNAAIKNYIDADKGQIAQQLRLFVDPIVWSRYQALKSMVLLPYSYLNVIKSGIDPKILKDPAPLIEAVKNALPGFDAYLNEHGVAGLPYLYEAMEAHIFEGLISGLNSSSHEQEIANVNKIDAAMALYKTTSWSSEPGPDFKSSAPAPTQP